MTSRKPLRLWPGVALAILVVILRFVAPLVVPDDLLLNDMPVVIIAILGAVIGALGIGVWWILFSRAPWLDRIGAIILMILGIIATSRLVHESIAGGNMGYLLYIYSIPFLGLALVVWAVATRGFPDGKRRAWMIAAVALACAPWVLGTHGWQLRRRLGFPLAVDTDARAAPAGPGQRRADASSGCSRRERHHGKFHCRRGSPGNQRTGRGAASSRRVWRQRHRPAGCECSSTWRERS